MIKRTIIIAVLLIAIIAYVTYSFVLPSLEKSEKSEIQKNNSLLSWTGKITLVLVVTIVLGIFGPLIGLSLLRKKKEKKKEKEKETEKEKEKSSSVTRKIITLAIVGVVVGLAFFAFISMKDSAPSENQGLKIVFPGKFDQKFFLSLILAAVLAGIIIYSRLAYKRDEDAPPFAAFVRQKTIEFIAAILFIIFFSVAGQIWEFPSPGLVMFIALFYLILIKFKKLAGIVTLVLLGPAIVFLMIQIVPGLMVFLEGRVNPTTILKQERKGAKVTVQNIKITNMKNEAKPDLDRLKELENKTNKGEVLSKDELEELNELEKRITTRNGVYNDKEVESLEITLFKKPEVLSQLERNTPSGTYNRVSRSSSSITQLNEKKWNVRFRGRNPGGFTIFSEAHGSYKITWLGGKILDNPRGNSYPVWGIGPGWDYDSGKRHLFQYQHIRGVRPMEVLIVLRKGETERVIQFPEGQRWKTIQAKGESLVLCYHDCNFQNNCGEGMLFEVEKPN